MRLACQGDFAKPQAGFCILKEAGGGIFGSKTSEFTGEATAELMGECSCVARSGIVTDTQLAGNTSLFVACPIKR